MEPLFVVQEIPDRDIHEEMKICKEKTGRKTVKEIKKVTRCYEDKKDPFIHARDQVVPTTWFEVRGSSIDGIRTR